MAVAVVSLSLPDVLLDEVDAAIGRGAYNSRSEFIRAAARDLLHRRHGPQDGHVHGSITLRYAHDDEARISAVRHAFHDVVISMVHTHCEPETCMDVLVVGGDSARVHELQEALARLRAVGRSTLSLMG